MVPISQSQPDKVYGPVTNPIITPNDVCTIFNLYIPAEFQGRTCTLEFIFPDMGTTTRDYSFSGGGHFTFSGYVGYGAEADTT
ncbi:hypothetical protein LTS18_006367, partial [Coniosporium uncinatum]